MILLLWTLDLIELLRLPGAYLFGENINNAGSIYQSQTGYLLFQILSILCLLLLITFSFFRHRFKWVYRILIVVNIFLFFYPIVTALE